MNDYSELELRSIGDKEEQLKPIISLVSVGVAYPDINKLSSEKFWALKDVSLDLYQGETLGVLGRNGAGKSTLLKLLSGILSPDKGKVYKRKGLTISLLALQLGFVPELSGRENAVLSCILLGLSKRQAVKRVKDIFAFAEIESAIDKPVGTYSSGMRARLGFGVAIEADPDVLLVDEVLGVGDAQFRKKSSTLLRERINSGRSVVIVSHELNTLRQLCDRVVVIEGGATTLSGETAKVVDAYQSLMVGK